MPSELEITVPDDVPVMTLPNVAFFPQALLPLHIFEPRYRRMLADVLAGNRLFAVAGLDGERAGEAGRREPPHRIAGMGIVRACQKNGNGTSNLLLQGLCRVEIRDILVEEPYRRIRIRVLMSEPGAAEDENRRLRAELEDLLARKLRLEETTAEMAGVLGSIEDPETFVDVAAFNLCESTDLRQRLLETLVVRERLELFSRRVRAEIAALRVQRKLPGLEGGDPGAGPN
jgi:Lon protease-like protein